MAHTNLFLCAKREEIMIEYEKRLTKNDSKTNIQVPFNMTEEFDYVEIKFNYTPTAENDPEKCLEAAEKALTLYFDGCKRSDQVIEASQFCPIRNLVTVSVDYKNEYLGNAHRFGDNQLIVISKTSPTKGFVKTKSIKGEYVLTLNVHLIFTEFCDVELYIEGGYYD